ncbi:MAG: hypothetical protein H0T41_01370 [Rhodobacteraceae bacterium]|nr:hypothetical protein [Paracoccaceae bacterium]
MLRVAPNVDGKLDIAPARPGPAEAAERLKRTLYRRLQEAFGDLERAAGNQQPEVSRRARAAQGRFAGDFAQADLVEVYLEVAWVRAEFDRRGEREGDDRFTNAAVAALNEIATIGPGLVLDNPEVEKLEDRRRRFAHDPLPPEAAAALEKLAETIADGDAVFGETLRQYAAATLATAEGTDDRRTVIQRVVTRNTIVAIGRWLANETSKKAYSGALGLAALWALKHESMIVTAASVWGDLFLAWLGPVFDQARAIAASAQSAGAIRPPPPRRRGPQ